MFDQAMQTRYLDAVAAGMRLAPAAAHVGITHNVPRRHERTDREFAAKLADAKTLGKQAREDALPHDESRYNNQGCRCPRCTRAASNARTGRRHADDGAGGDVVDLTPGVESPTSFSLLRAS